MPPAQSIYTCRDIREIPQEKEVTYARALQHWAEETDLPAGGGPCLLAKSVKELREEVKCYLSFSDEEVFQGVVLPTKEDDQSLETMSPGHPVHQSWPWRGEDLSSWGGKSSASPQPVVATGEITQPSKSSRPRVRPIQLPWAGPAKPPASQSETPTPSKASSPYRHWQSYG